MIDAVSTTPNPEVEGNKTTIEPDGTQFAQLVEANTSAASSTGSGAVPTSLVPLSLELAQQAVADRLQNIEKAEAKVKLAEQKFQAGLGSKVKVFEAKAELVQAQIEHQKALVIESNAAYHSQLASGDSGADQASLARQNAELTLGAYTEIKKLTQEGKKLASDGVLLNTAHLRAYESWVSKATQDGRINVPDAILSAPTDHAHLKALNKNFHEDSVTAEKVIATATTVLNNMQPVLK